MSRLVFGFFVLFLTKNVLSQMIGKGLTNNVVASSAGNIGAGNLANFGNGAANFAANNAVLNNAGVNLANSGANTFTLGNFGNSVASNLAGNTAAKATGVAVGNFAGNSVGNIGVPGITNLKFGEIEYVKDVNVNGLSGEYPVIGYVTFEGYIPATGTVTVANDGCGCLN